MSPYLFRIPEFLPFIGGRPIFSYGVMLGIAFMLGWSLTLFLAEREGTDRKTGSNALFATIVGSLIGARLFFFLTATEQPLTLTNFLKFSEGGMVAYGGYIGGFLSGWAYLAYKKANFWSFVDCAAPTLALGLGIVRVGCFLYGCDYGVAHDSAFSLHFPMWDNPGVEAWIHGNAPAFDAHARAGLLEPGAVVSLGVWPTQIVASFAGFLIFGVLLLFRRYKRFHGEVLLVFAVTYSLFRFMIEFFRGDLNRGVGWFGTGMSSSQVIGIAIIVASAIGWWILSKKKERTA